jgi:hypothetical protein
MTDFRTPLPAVPLAESGATIAGRLDAARERAIRLLTDGFAYDVITVDEFEWRLGQLSLASSSHAIDALVADLAAPAHGLAVSAPSSATMPPSEGRILGIMSETRREGPWRVPQALRVKAVMSEVKLDLRYAVLPPNCTIDISALMANVSFTVPPGMIVDFDVSSIMASTRNEARGEGMTGYALHHVRIRGSAIMAEVRVRVRGLGR